MSDKNEEKKSDSEGLRYVGWLLAYHVPLLALMLWFVLSDINRFEKIMNDPANRWTILAISVGLLAGSLLVAVVAHPQLRQLLLNRFKQPHDRRK